MRNFLTQDTFKHKTGKMRNNENSTLFFKWNVKIRTNTIRSAFCGKRSPI